MVYKMQTFEKGVMIMFANLKAEQARNNMTNEYVAKQLGLSRVSYEHKKKSGRFVIHECKKLCFLFEKNFEYLFQTTESGVQESETS